MSLNTDVYRNDRALRRRTHSIIPLVNCRDPHGTFTLASLIGQHERLLCRFGALCSFAAFYFSNGD